MGLRKWIAGRLGGAAAADSGPLQFNVAAVTDRGLARGDNQDSYIMRKDEFFLAVADGMGGGEGGALASAWICDAFAEMLSLAPLSFIDRVAKTAEALDSANARIRAYMKERGIKMMGSTAAVLLADPDRARRAVIAHVGDSRIYRWRRGKGTLLTRDHTVGNEIGRALSGNSQAEALKSRQNPLAHILTRAVGTGFKVRPDWRKVDLVAGDRYILCTDGVHDVMGDDEVAAHLGRAKTPADAVKAFARSVIAAGAPDNYTLVCVFVEKS